MYRTPKNIRKKTDMLSLCFRVVNYADPSALASKSSLHSMNFLVLIFIRQSASGQ